METKLLYKFKDYYLKSSKLKIRLGGPHPIQFSAAVTVFSMHLCLHVQCFAKLVGEDVHF